MISLFVMWVAVNAQYLNPLKWWYSNPIISFLFISWHISKNASPFLYFSYHWPRSPRKGRINTRIFPFIIYQFQDYKLDPHHLLKVTSWIFILKIIIHSWIQTYFDIFWSITNISLIIAEMVPNLANGSLCKLGPESFWHHLIVSASFLTTWSDEMFQFILYTSFPRSRVSHFSKSPGFF